MQFYTLIHALELFIQSGLGHCACFSPVSKSLRGWRSLVIAYHSDASRRCTDSLGHPEAEPAQAQQDRYMASLQVNAALVQKLPEPARAVNQDSFQIHTLSKHISGSPRTNGKSTILSCNIFVPVSSSTTFLDFKTEFCQIALRHHFPNLERGEGAVPDNDWNGAIVAGKQRLEIEVLIRNESENFAVGEHNWDSVVARARMGQKLTVIWVVQNCN